MNIFFSKLIVKTIFKQFLLINNINVCSVSIPSKISHLTITNNLSWLFLINILFSNATISRSKGFLFANTCRLCLFLCCHGNPRQDAFPLSLLKIELVPRSCIFLSSSFSWWNSFEVLSPTPGGTYLETITAQTRFSFPDVIIANM